MNYIKYNTDRQKYTLYNFITFLKVNLSQIFLEFVMRNFIQDTLAFTKQDI